MAEKTGERWWELAECKEEAPELFYPADDHKLTRYQIKAAQAVCARCIVSAECLEDTLIHPDQVSIRGGLTPGQRERRKNLNVA